MDHPRMRGEHTSLEARPRCWRGIIPACAGSTRFPPSPGRCAAGSSPHARGAHVGLASLELLGGDHPRMRGEHRVRQRKRQRPYGIIPACAGSTAILDFGQPQSWGSSPHARGAHPCGPCDSHDGGDHPRMRGEHGQKLVDYAPAPRIIPACAGSTARLYPATASVKGSSPHARGAQGFAKKKLTENQDHPRMRGEH